MLRQILGKKIWMQGAVLCLTLVSANCSGKTYSTFFQPFDLIFGSQSSSNSSVNGNLIAATPLTNTRVMLTFSKPVNLSSGQTVSNYRITDANGNLLQILAASRDPNNSNIIFLDTIPQAVGTQYTARVSGISFVDGAALGNASATFTAPNNADQTGPEFGSVTALSNTTVEVYFNEAISQTNPATGAAYSNATFGGYFDIYTDAGCSSGNVDVTSATRDTSNYAKVTLTTATGLNPGGTYYVCATTNVRDVWGNSKTTVIANSAVVASSPFTFNAPTPRVASITSASPSTILITYTEDMDTTGIAGTALTNRTIYTINQCSGGGSLTLPTNGTVVGTRSVIFTGVTQTGTVNQGSCYLTVTIPGGTTCDTTAGLVCSAAGARLTTAGNTGVLAYNNSTANDTTPPAIVGVTTTNSNTVVVTFSEAVTGVSIGDFGFSPALNVTNVSCTGNVCTLTTDDQSTTSYTLSVNNSAGGIQDLATPANTLSSGSTTFTGDGKPYIVAIYPIDSSTVMVEWSEPIGNAASVGPTDYSIAGATITAAALDPVGLDPSKFVKLTISPVLTAGTVYTLSVNNPTGSVDSAGNPTLGTVPNGGTFTGPTATTRPQLVSATSSSATSILVTFNEPLNNATIQAADFSLSGVGCPITPTQTIASATQVQAGVIQLILNPVPAVTTSSTICQVTLATLDSVSDLAGNGNAAGIQLPSPYSFTGTATADTTAPTVASVVAFSNTEVRVYFSESVTTGTGQNLSNYAFSPALTGGINNISCAGTVCTITLNAPGTSAVQYALTVSGVQDAATNTMASQTVNFSGIGSSATAPTLFMATLINSTTVELSFSESMNLITSQNAANYTVSGGNTVSAAVRQADTTKVRLTITPGAYGSSNTYTVTATGVTDLSGNTIGTPNSATFSGSGSAPSTASLAVASDTGSVGDNITGVNLTSPGLQFTGTTTPNTTVVLYHSPGVSFTDAGDLVTLNSHGLANGTAVSFTTINSTTGIATNTTYYVINATANTFQLATTPGGAVVPLTTDGTGILNTPIPYATAVSGPTGTYTVTVPSTATIPQGTNQFNIATVGPTGLVSDLSQTFSITYDSNAPSAPTGLALVAATDTGGSNSDQITNAASLQFSVTCETGASVQLRDGTTNLGSPVTCSGGTATITTTALTATGQTGTTYPNINVIQTDAADNQSTASANLSVRVDNTAPGLTSSNLSAGNLYVELVLNEAAYGSIANLTTALSAASFNISTTGGTAAASINCVTSAASSVCPGVAPAAGATTVRVQLTITGTVAGTEQVTITSAANSIFDSAGNAASINTGPKTLAVGGVANITGGTYTAPALPAGTGSTSGYVTVNFSDVAYGNVGLSAGVGAGNLSTSLDTTGNATTVSIACVKTTAAADCSAGNDPAGAETSLRVFLTFNNPPSGAEVVRVSAAAGQLFSTGGANGAGSSTGGLNVTDRLAPAAPGTADMTALTDTGASNTDNTTTNQTPQFTVSCENGATVQLYTDNPAAGTATGTTGTCASGTVTLTAATLAAGAHNITSRQTDAAGNLGTASAALAVTIDTSAPAATGTPDLTAATDTGSSNSDNITNNQTPQFTVSCETNATVQLYTDNPAAGTATGGTGTCAAGTVTLTAATLASGTHNITARQTDPAGNLGPASTALAVTIDASTPAATGTPDMTAATDSGSSNSDNITNNQTPQFTASCENGATVQLYTDTPAAGTATGVTGTCAGGTVTLTAATLATGTHNITVRQTDVAGNQSTASTSLAVTIDASTPAATGTPDMTAATDSGSSNSDNITNNQTPQFTVSCETGTTVQLYTDNPAAGTATGATGTCASSTVTLTAATLPAGAHNITARQTDTAGNQSAASTALAVTIDTSTPAATGTPDMTAATDAGSSNTDNNTNNQTPQFTVSCENGATVQLYTDNPAAGTATGTTGTCAGGTVTLTAATLGEGSHNISARQTDAAGHQSAASTALAVTIDITAPAATGTPDLTAATDSGSSNSDNITNDQTPQFTVSCITGSTVQLYTDNPAAGTATGVTGTCAGSTVTLTAATLASGAHNITSRQTDPAGNQGVASTALAVTIDTTAPAATGTPDMTAATDTGSSNSDNNTSNQTPQFTMSCEDGATVQLYTDNPAAGTATGVTGTCTSSTVTLTAATLAAGAHNITARQTDVAGNQGIDSTALAVTIDTGVPAATGTPDMTAATDSGSSNSDNNTNNQTPQFTLSCENGATVQLYTDNPAAGTATGSTGTCAAGTVTLTAATLTSGAHNITGRQTDAAGNQGAASTALAVTIDTSAPAATGTPDMTAATDSGSSNSDNNTTNQTPQFTVSCENGATVQLYTDNPAAGTATGTTGTCASSTVTLTAATLAAGAHNITARQTDAAGNQSVASSALAVTVDTTAPTISSVAPATNAYVNNTQVSYTFSEAAGSGSVTWTRTGGTADGSSPHVQALTGGELATGAHSSITLTNNPTLVSGTIYTITWNATDAAGNAATAVTSTNVTYDTTLPVISAVSPASSSSVNNTSVSYTLSEVCQSGSITWTRTGGTADGGSPHTRALTGSELNAGTFTGTITNNPTLVDGTIYSVAFNCTDRAGNVATTVTSTSVTYSPGVLAITTAETMDTDNDGKIDTYRVSFNKPVNDSTFPGYSANALGSVTTYWLVAGYTNVRLIHGSAVTFATDTANDATIYIRFDENVQTCSSASQVGCDTDAKPDLTTTAVVGDPRIEDLTTAKLGIVSTGTVTESDGSKPVLIAARSLSTTTADAIFSEPVDTTTAQTATNYTISGGSNPTVSAATRDGTNTNIVHLTTGTQTGGQAYTLTVNTNVKDLANLSMNSSANTANFTGVQNPVVSSVVTTSATTLTITFNETVTAASTECTSTAACALIYDNTSIPILSAVSTGGTGVNSATFTLTVNPMVEGQSYTVTVLQNTVTSVATGNKMLNTNNSATFNGDGKPGASISSDTVTTCPAAGADQYKKVIVQYDQAVSATALTATNYKITGCVTGTCSSGATGANTSGAATVTSLGGNKYEVKFTDQLLLTTALFQMTISGVQDTNSNTIAAPGNLTFQCGSDSTKPMLAGATVVTATAGSTVVLLSFSEAIDNVTGNVSTNYKYDAQAYGANVQSAARQSNTAQVLVTFQPALANGGHQIRVQNVQDLATNAIDDNGTTNVQPIIVNAPTGFTGGPIFTDPFGDGTTAGTIVIYDQKLYLGADSASTKLFEMNYALTQAQTITLDADGTFGTPYSSFNGYATKWSGCASITYPGTPCSSGNLISGVDTIYAACVGGTSTPSMTGTACTGAGGTERMYIGALNTQGNYRSFWHTSTKSSSSTVFPFTEEWSGDTGGGFAYRSLNLLMFKDQLFVNFGAEQGGGGRGGRVCMNPSGCADGTAYLGYVGFPNMSRLTRIGAQSATTGAYRQNGSLPSAAGYSGPGDAADTTGNVLNAITVMYEHDNDGAGGNESQLYLANGGYYGGTLGSARTTTTDGGIVRTTVARSAKNSLPLNCPAGNGCSEYYEDVTPDALTKWNTYISIPLPQNSSITGSANCSTSFIEMDCVRPYNIFVPGLKAIPYMRTAPNGDLYMLRNACSTTNLNRNAKNGAGGFDFRTERQVCPKGYEIPQLWMLPKNCGTASACAAAWQLVAEYGTTGITNMAANTGSCGTAPNKCTRNTHATLLEFVGNYLYIGWDNATDGANVWRVDFNSATCTGSASCMTSGNKPAQTQFQIVNLPGIETASGGTNQKIFSHVTVNDAGKDWLIIITRDGTSAMKIYRTANDQN